jgi:hypothetical protein
MSNILIPDPLHSDEQYNRFHHLDIPYMETHELVDEFHYLRAHFWGLLADDWRRERVRMLESELKKRKVGMKNAIY